MKIPDPRRPDLLDDKVTDGTKRSGSGTLKFPNVTDRREWLLGELKCLRKAQGPDAELAFFLNIAQLSYLADEATLDGLADEYLDHSDFRLRALMCYTLGVSRRPVFRAYLERLADDPVPEVRRDAEEAMDRLAEVVAESFGEVSGQAVEALDALLRFSGPPFVSLREGFWRAQFLSKVVHLTRDQVFPALVEGSLQQALATDMINAANRINPKRLRVRHITSFCNAARALRQQTCSPKVVRALSRELAEIDG